MSKENQKQYGSITRLENLIIEEKLDGSNFAFIKQRDGVIKFYSRNQELEYGVTDKFFNKFIEYIKRIDSLNNLPVNFMFFGEALGMGKIKYFTNEILEQKIKDQFGHYYNKISDILINSEKVHNQLYIFDIEDRNYYNHKIFLNRLQMENICNSLGLNIVPLTIFNKENSELNPNVKREGIILRNDIYNNYFKIKLVERKYKNNVQYKQNIKVEILKNE